MKDAGQKAMLYRHFRAHGWYSMLEVPVFPRDGAAERPKLVTDVDVLALRAGADLRWEVVVGDCKTRKSESPANRALWVRALMDHFQASRGYVVLKRERNAIEPDHKLMADGLGVTLLDEGEFAAYDRAVLFPSGSTRLRESADELLSLYQGLRGRFPKLVPLCDYLTGAAWSERDTLAMTRRALAEGLAARAEIDPSKPEHLALALELSGVASVGIASAVAKVFSQHVQPDDRNLLDETLKALVWGGRERYEAVTAMRRQLLAAHGGGTEEDWALPRWSGFVQLVRNLLESPRLAFRLPHLFRAGALDLTSGRPFAQSIGSGMALRLGLLAATYVVQASGFPPEVVARLRELFMPRITETTMPHRSEARREAAVSDAQEAGHEQTVLPGLDPPRPAEGE